MTEKLCNHEWMLIAPGLVECQKCRRKVRPNWTREEIREGLAKIKLPSSYKQLRKMYEENPKYQHVSFEKFVEGVRTIKKIIDEAKLRYKVK